MIPLEIITKGLKSTTSVDTIILSYRYNSRTYDKVTKYPRNINGYVIESTDNKDPINFALSLRKGGYDKNFLHIDFTKYKCGSEEYVSTYITIHINHFLFQHFKSLVVSREPVISKLQYLVGQLLHFPTFELDKMDVSEVHLCSDLILNHDVNHYLELLSHIPFKDYIAVPTNGNNTISVHSSTSRDVLFKDTEREPHELLCMALATIYNKQKKLNEQFFDTAYNIIRFEFKFEEGKKNGLQHTILDFEKIIGEKRDRGIIRFSDIFSVDIAKAVTEHMFEKHLFEYRGKKLEDLLTRQHNSQSRKYLTLYSNTYSNRDDHEFYSELNSVTSKKKQKLLRGNYKQYKHYNFLKCPEENVPNGNVKYFDLYKELCEKTSSLNDVQEGLINCYRLYSHYSPHHMTEELLPRYENEIDDWVNLIIHDHNMDPVYVE